MDIAKYASEKAAVDAHNAAAVKVFKGSQEQTEAVLNILLGSIQQTAPRAPEQTGHRINIKA